jgi:lysyl endopeptidase
VKYFYSILFFTFFTNIHSWTQISKGGIPPGLKYRLKSADASIIELPSVDTNKLIAQDNAGTISELKPYRFAYNHSVNYSIYNSGKWETLNDGSSLWKIRIRSRGAYSLMIYFSEFELQDGAKLFLYDKNSKFILGAYTSDNNNEYRAMNTTPVPGDIVTIEYIIPAGISEKGLLTIGMVGHDYKNAFGYNALKDGYYKSSKSCETDINCNLDKNWQIEKHAVCRMIIPHSDDHQSYLCTGTLINNTSQDGTPFVLCANHCLFDQYGASGAIFLFNYESPYCQGPDGSTVQSISVGTLKATTNHLDFSLTEMSSKPPFSYYPYYAGWNISTSGINNVVTIHHPAGDVKKISTYNNFPFASNFSGVAYDPNTHWQVTKWNEGITEGGSSGAALFDQSHRIIGDLSGGPNFVCGCNSNCADYFEMISHSWADYTPSNNQLKYWLDPLNLGVKALNGLDIYAAYKKTCDTLINIISSEIPVLLNYPIWGYWSGSNSDQVTKYAESFNLPDSTNLTGVYFGIAKNTYASSNSYINLNVWESGSDSLPGNQIVSKIIAMNSLQVNNISFIPLNEAVKTAGKVFVGFEIFYNSPLDTFAVFSSPKRTTGTESNTAYAFVNNKWNNLKTMDGDQFGLSLQIEPVFCSLLPPNAFPPLKTTKTQKSTTAKVICYPNPSEGNFTIEIPDASGDKVHVEILNIQGSIVFSDLAEPGTNEYRCSLTSDGIYIVHLSCSSWVATSKIVINK